VEALQGVVRRADDEQRRKPFLAFPLAVLKKFGEDRAGQLAALIAYYGFFSLFPMLLAFVTLSGIVFKESDTHLERAGFSRRGSLGRGDFAFSHLAHEHRNGAERSVRPPPLHLSSGAETVSAGQRIPAQAAVQALPPAEVGHAVDHGREFLGVADAPKEIGRDELDLSPVHEAG
jgi:hypothetical protein